MLALAVQTSEMDAPGTVLAEVYRPQLGRSIVGLAWLPLTSDTPDLVRDFGRASLSFTGGVEIRFEGGGTIFLTWRTPGPMTLAAGAEGDWSPGALDRISANMNSNWERVIGSTLEGVDLFTGPSILEERPLEGAPVGARHRVRAPEGLHQFWVGTASGAKLGEGDDLWVGLDVEPENMPDLEQVAAIAM